VSNLLPDLVRDLLRPAAYGSRSNRVELRTTHASWVFLTEEDVWKVKRPVDLGFLDFKTLSARLRDCEDEIRLNQRLAPDVYLDVVPIRQTPHGHSLVAVDGPIVEWAVHMRRLPDEASAAALLARGQLGAESLEEVAAELAAFLQSARPAPAFGTPAALSLNLDENFAQVAPFVGTLLDKRTFDDVQAFQRGELARNWPRFVARVAEEHIREGHGDLRLEHVYLPATRGQRRPTIIDCIEFNERFRCGDAAAEIAFLSMELEAAGRPDLAAGFVARFAEASDDFGLYGVLDFYLSYRAWVRGKVASFLATDPAMAADIRESKREEAHRCFALARSFSGAPVDRPFMIVVGGVIGSGKSVLAAELGRELAAPVVSSDRTRKLAGGLPLTARADASFYHHDERERTYAEVIRRAREVIEAGRGVVVDATFSTRRWRQVAAATARASNAAFVFIEASCPLDLIRRRLVARRAHPSVSDATDQLLQAFLEQYEAVTSFDPGPYLGIDTSGSPQATVRDALRRLSGLGILKATDRRAS
jgi:aminoglycoside phosphotransferase family enzyme/predicted kinase